MKEVETITIYCEYGYIERSDLPGTVVSGAEVVNVTADATRWQRFKWWVQYWLRWPRRSD